MAHDQVRPHSLRPLMPVIVVFLALAGLLWWGFDTLIEHRHYPNRGLATGAGAPVRIVLERSPGGHYYVPGEINGQRVRFLVDTGATGIAVPGHVAARLGLERGRRVPVHTAGGRVRAYMTHLESVAIGGITRYNLKGYIIPSMEQSVVLLGTGFLEYVDYHQVGDRLIIEPE